MKRRNCQRNDRQLVKSNFLNDRSINSVRQLASSSRGFNIPDVASERRGLHPVTPNVFSEDMGGTIHEIDRDGRYRGCSLEIFFQVIRCRESAHVGTSRPPCNAECTVHVQLLASSFAKKCNAVSVNRLMPSPDTTVSSRSPISSGSNTPLNIR
jgi:hypothetical protein